jgi:hypothetical protein
MTDKNLPLDIEIPGEFPDGKKVIHVDTPDGEALADMVLHRSDLKFARDSLDAINHPGITPHIQESLWRSSITHLYKCFQRHESRKRLLVDDVYAGAPEQARRNFEFFRNVRNKQLVHDENSSTQSFTVAVLNNGSKAHKIEAVRALAMSFQLLGPEGQQNYESFYQVVVRVQEWVTREFDKLQAKIHADLEKLSYAELDGMPPVVGHVPTLAEAGRKRAR